MRRVTIAALMVLVLMGAADSRRLLNARWKMGDNAFGGSLALSQGIILRSLRPVTATPRSPRNSPPRSERR